MKPRDTEPGIILESQDIGYIQDEYIENCRPFSRMPISPDTDPTSPLELTVEESYLVRHALRVGALCLEANIRSRSSNALRRVVLQASIRRDEVRLSNLTAFGDTLDQTLLVSKQDHAARQNV